MSEKYELLKDETVTKEVRYISIMGKFHRYDFAFIDDKDNPAKKIVIDLYRNRFAIMGPDDIVKPGEIEHLFQVTELEADEIRTFLDNFFQSN